MLKQYNYEQYFNFEISIMHKNVVKQLEEDMFIKIKRDKLVFKS